MKKIYTTSKYRRRNLSHARIQLLKKLKFKRTKSKKNREFQGFTKKEIALKRREERYLDYKKVKVPVRFSFIRHPEEVIKFIEQLQEHYRNNKRVFVVMNHVQFIDYDAIVVLLSVMVKFKSQGIKFNGDFPDIPEVKKILLDSGFIHKLYEDKIKASDRYEIINKMHTHAWNEVDSELGLRIMEEVTPKIMGSKRVLKGLQRSLVELMHNSHNHATPNQEGAKQWWLSVNFKNKEKKATFSFIDYGVGIFASLNSKQQGSKWYGWGEKVANFFTVSDNSEILRLILEGQLHRTVTGKHYRGKGLPGIKEAMDRNLISNLHIITNDVYVNAKDNVYRTLSHNFNGTFVYWEINKDTLSHEWKL